MISKEEAIKILKWLHKEIGESHSTTVNDYKLAGAIEGILLMFGWIKAGSLYEFHMVEVENPSVATIFLPKSWIKQTVHRNETYLEYMHRQAFEYIQVETAKDLK